MGCMIKVWIVPEVTPVKAASAASHKATQSLDISEVPIPASPVAPVPSRPPQSPRLKPPVALKRSLSQDFRQSLTFSNGLSISTSSEDASILFEGPLLKYKPGLSHNFLERWCQLTPFEFLLYRSVDAARSHHRPLLQISLSKIDKIVKIEELFQRKHLIEIFLLDEDKMVPLNREAQNEVVDKNVVAGTYTHDYKAAVENGKLMKKPVRGYENDPGVIVNKVGWSFREIEWYSSEKRLLFSFASAAQRDLCVSAVEKELYII